MTCARAAPTLPARRARQAGFVVRALDRFGNPVPLAAAAAFGARGFEATLAQAGADSEPLALAMAGSPGASACAELRAGFQATAAGPATLAVTYAGASVRGSPWQACGAAAQPRPAMPRPAVLRSQVALQRQQNSASDEAPAECDARLAGQRSSG